MLTIDLSVSRSVELLLARAPAESQRLTLSVNRFATEVIHKWDRSSALLIQRIVSNWLTIGLSVSRSVEPDECGAPTVSQCLTLSVNQFATEVILQSRRSSELLSQRIVSNWLRRFFEYFWPLDSFLENFSVQECKIRKVQYYFRVTGIALGRWIDWILSSCSASQLPLATNQLVARKKPTNQCFFCTFELG